MKKSVIKHPHYNRWTQMKFRCSSSKCKEWKHYGGRGIGVCQRWLDSFQLFCEDIGECPDGSSLDRIDNDGDYEPSNCKWSTISEQMENRRSTIHITLDGVTMTCLEWADRLNLNPHKIRCRIYRGDSAKDVLRPNGAVKKTISGYKGVHVAKNRWAAKVWKSGKNINLGNFVCRHEAAKIYNTAVRMLCGPDSYINPIQI